MSTVTSPLRLTLHAQPVREPAKRFPITARFTNVSADPVRMLAVFDPLPVFFTTSLEPLAGGAIDVAGAGKADYPDDALHHRDLAVGESVDATLDLAPWIRSAVAPGRYRLSLTYHNAYGRDSFRGPLTSAPVTIDVDGTP